MKAGLLCRKAAALFFVLVFVLGMSVLAHATNDEIEYVQNQKDEDEQALASTEERILALEASKSSNEAYLAELSLQLTDLTNELIETNAQLEEKETELAKIEAEIEKLEYEADEQYEDMKIRIQYLYEAGAGAGVFVSMFSADSFTEFLNRAENYSELNRFDRKMLQNYENTLESIRNNQETLLTEKEEILQIKNELAQRQSQTQQLYEAAYHDMMDCIAELDGAETEYAAIIEELQAKEDLMNELLRQQYEAEAAAALAAQQAAQEALESENIPQEYQDDEEEAFEPAAAQPAAAEEEPEIPSEEESQPVAPEMPSEEQPAVQEDQPSEPGQTEPEEAEQEESEPEEISTPEEQQEEQNEEETGEEPGEPEEPSTGDMTYLGNFTLTAYCACAQCCGAYATGYTASGTLATEGVTVAMGGVDFGTKLCINGHIYTVEDRGTAYGHVDIFFASHEAALAFGLQYADVYRVN